MRNVWLYLDPPEGGIATPLPPSDGSQLYTFHGYHEIQFVQISTIFKASLTTRSFKSTMTKKKTIIEPSKISQKLKYCKPNGKHYTLI